MAMKSFDTGNLCMKNILSTVVAVGLAFPAISAAATNNSVSLQNGGSSAGCGSVPSVNFSETSTIDENINDGAVGCTMSLDGYAGGGAVGIRGTLNHVPGGITFSQIGASATSAMTDISLTPLFDVNDRNEPFNQDFSVVVTLNAIVDGTLTAIVDNDTISSQGGNTTFKAIASLSAGSGTDSRQYLASAGASNPGSPTSDAAILDSVLNPSIVIDWRIPFSASFNLQGDAAAASGGVSFVTSTFDSYNSLSFSKDGPAFILPEGFTVNAPELNIIDNQWIDPRANVVPLPAGLPLLLSGLAVLGLLRRRSQ